MSVPGHFRPFSTDPASLAGRFMSASSRKGPGAGHDGQKGALRQQAYDSSFQTGELQIMRYELTDHEGAAVGRCCRISRVASHG